MLCTGLISGSHSSQDVYIAYCQAASVLSIGYCYACTLAFLGLSKLFVPTLLLFLFRGSKSHLPSLGLHHDSASTYIRASLSIESWAACIMRTTTCSTRMPMHCIQSGQTDRLTHGHMTLACFSHGGYKHWIESVRLGMQLPIWTVQQWPEASTNNANLTLMLNNYWWCHIIINVLQHALCTLY